MAKTAGQVQRMSMFLPPAERSKLLLESMAGITGAQIAGSSKKLVEANTDKASGVVNVGAVTGALGTLGQTGLAMFEKAAAEPWTGLSEDQRKILESDFKAEAALNIEEQKKNMRASNLEVYAGRDARNEALRSLGGPENAAAAAEDDRKQRANVQRDIENGNLSGPDGQRAVPWFAAAVEDPATGRISSPSIEERARNLVRSWQRAADTKDFTVNMALDVAVLENEIKEMGLTKLALQETEDGPVYGEFPLTDDDIKWTVFNTVANELMNYKGLGSGGFLFDRARELDARVKDIAGGNKEDAVKDPEVLRRIDELGGAAREAYLRAILSAGNAAELEELTRTASADFLVKEMPLLNTEQTRKRITDARSGVTGQMPKGDFEKLFRNTLDLGTLPGQDPGAVRYSPADTDSTAAVKAETASRLASRYGGDGGDFYPQFIKDDKAPYWRFIRPDGSGGWEIYDVKMINKKITALPMKITAGGLE
jgi:hypothetical protein